MLVLNGNGVEGSASTARLPALAARLPHDRAAQRAAGQRAELRLLPDTGSFRCPRERSEAGGREEAREPLRHRGREDPPPRIRALGNDAMIVVVLGQTFHGRLASAPIDQTPKRQPAAVVSGASAVVDLLREHRREIQFPLMVPTRIERSSWIDPEMPVRTYWIDPDPGASSGAPDVPPRDERVLGGPDDGLGGTHPSYPGGTSSARSAAGAPSLLQRPRLHMVELRSDRRHVLGRQLAAGPTLQRDDDRGSPRACSPSPR